MCVPVASRVDTARRDTRMEIDAALEIAHETGTRALGAGRVAGYIPALAPVNPDRFGMAVCDLRGEARAIGAATPFSIQSISKVFALALALAHDEALVWRRVGQRPSAGAFNALTQLEGDSTFPPNPFLNAGALVITDILISRFGDASATVIGLLRAEAANPGLAFDLEVAHSELATSHRNTALAHYLAEFGLIENTVEEVLKHYVLQCSVNVSCSDLARATVFLANAGVGHKGRRIVPDAVAKRINALMTTCGVYDGATEFAYRVGLPGKSGIGGGIVAIAPRRGTICVWSPRLDACGNSVAGVAALEAFIELTPKWIGDHH
jgi:glutaminase